MDDSYCSDYNTPTAAYQPSSHPLSTFEIQVPASSSTTGVAVTNHILQAQQQQQQQQQQSNFSLGHQQINNPQQQFGSTASSYQYESTLSAYHGASRISVQDVDYQTLLLGLAEEYLSTARRFSPTAARGRQSFDTNDYCKLIALALGCLESVLVRWRLQPHREALIRLKIANILYEETDNDAEIEAVLTKGIAICERNRFLDLKHSMQFLLSRVLFKSNRIAATKLIDGTIDDVEAYQLVSWTYACRFLRVSFHQDMTSTSGFTGTLHNIRRICSIARARKDDAVVLIASVTEAQLYLLSSNQGALEHAQAALATARSLQLTGAASRLPQVTIYIRILDLLCSILGTNIRQARFKMQELLPIMEPTLTDPNWTDDGTIFIPIHPESSPGNAYCSGAINTGPDGIQRLAFSWIPKREMRMLICLVCGIATGPTTVADMDQAEQLFLQVLHDASTSLDDNRHSDSAAHRGLVPLVRNDEPSQCLSLAFAQQSRQRKLAAYARLHLALLLASQTQWNRARDLLEQSSEDLDSLNDSESYVLASLARYVAGVVYQGTGDLDAALEVFRGPTFDTTAKFCQEPNDSSQRTRRDLSILANLNVILILRGRRHKHDQNLSTLIVKTERLCAVSANRHIHSALNFIKACSQETDSMIVSKRYLEQALIIARQLSNLQLICIAMNFLNWKFLRGVVGEQAEKGARAAVNTASNSGNQMWVSVSKAMLADTLEVQGKLTEARTVRAQAKELAETISLGL